MCFVTTSEKYKLRLKAENCGDDLCITLIGGDRPHIGAVSMAVPRVSLTGSGASCDCWTTTAPGHKDYSIAQVIANKLCIYTQKTVSVLVGIHIDQATSQQLREIWEQCLCLAEKFCVAWDKENKI